MVGGRREVLGMGCCTWVGNGGISWRLGSLHFVFWFGLSG
jgi:hypothetical protein